MNKKIYLSSVAAAALLSACSSDELVPQQSGEATDVLANRPKIEVALGFDNADTRMITGENNMGVYFDVNDTLGAVLVDQGSSDPDSYFDLVTTNTHIGNNKFYYDAATGKFVTDGTMCVGSWLFYTPYNKANTTSRDGIKFDLPTVQTYSKDYTEIVKKDWRFTPIVNLKGQEDGYFTYKIPTISAYTYAWVKLKFNEKVTVQKLVLKPSSNISGTEYAPFAHTYELNMGSAGTGKGLAAAVADLNSVPHHTGETLQDCLDEKENQLLSKDNYIEEVTKISGNDKEELIALNCLDSDLEASEDFESYMLIPSGKYTCIRLYAYTDKGVYVYNINDECEAAPNESRLVTLGTADSGEITLKREGGVSLHNIAGYTSETNPDFAALEVKAIKMTETKTVGELQEESETEGSVVISQKDLIAVINGIKDPGVMKVRVLGNMVKITKDVAKAIADKEKALPGDIQVVFDNPVQIEGDTEAYNLTDVTLNGGATLTKGAVNVGEDVNIPAEQHLTVNSGATLNVNTVANNDATKNYTYNKIVNNGTMNVNKDHITISTVENNGTLTVKDNATITNLTNKGTATVEADKTLTTALTNQTTSATFTNNGTVILDGESTNNGNIANAGVIYVENVILTNNSKIVNSKDAKIISGKAGDDKAEIVNMVGATIDNSGFLYCFNGDNTITNLGTINAKKGSTTYITNNASKEEGTVGTKDENINMGVINLDSRDEDISVTTAKKKGYIVFTTDLDNITPIAGDKFNKVVLSADATVNDVNVRFIETSAAKLTIENTNVQELTFKSHATLTTTTATVAYLEIAEGKVVKVPTENVIAVENVSFSTENGSKVNSKTDAQIVNKGTLLVGGDLYSSAISTCPTDGIFASGDGNTTAFHWGTAKQ